mmetsp:Transcript_65641/g.173839  ORF Transcript_65641/g.173839 Transcript_65641/m.173839 type:complete len:246 (+) Transcript_65641:1507-2244(+)
MFGHLEALLPPAEMFLAGTLDLMICFAPSRPCRTAHLDGEFAQTARGPHQPFATRAVGFSASFGPAIPRCAWRAAALFLPGPSTYAPTGVLLHPTESSFELGHVPATLAESPQVSLAPADLISWETGTASGEELKCHQKTTPRTEAHHRAMASVQQDEAPIWSPVRPNVQGALATSLLGRALKLELLGEHPRRFLLQDRAPFPNRPVLKPSSRTALHDRKPLDSCRGRAFARRLCTTLQRQVPGA